MTESSSTNYLSTDAGSRLQFLRCKYMSMYNVAHIRKVHQISTISVKHTAAVVLATV